MFIIITKFELSGNPRLLEFPPCDIQQLKQDEEWNPSFQISCGLYFKASVIWAASDCLDWQAMESSVFQQEKALKSMLYLFCFLLFLPVSASWVGPPLSPRIAIFIVKILFSLITALNTEPAGFCIQTHFQSLNSYWRSWMEILKSNKIFDFFQYLLIIDLKLYIFMECSALFWYIYTLCNDWGNCLHQPGTLIALWRKIQNSLL